MYAGMCGRRLITIEDYRLAFKNLCRIENIRLVSVERSGETVVTVFTDRPVSEEIKNHIKQLMVTGTSINLATYYDRLN